LDAFCARCGYNSGKNRFLYFLKDLQIYEKPPLVACCAARGGGIFGARADEIVRCGAVGNMQCRYLSVSLLRFKEEPLK
jgi:hypothetical protein